MKTEDAAPVSRPRCPALEEPLRQIANNAGHEGSLVVQKVKTLGKHESFDALSEDYGDLVQRGIVDPLKVVRAALENAASIAGMLLTTEALVAEKPEKRPPAGGGGYPPPDHDY